MPTQLTKSQLIEKIAEDTELGKKRREGGHREHGDCWPQGTQEGGRFSCAWLCEVRRHQETRHQRAKGHQSVHERAYRV
jgi:hypothetical protein